MYEWIRAACLTLVALIAAAAPIQRTFDVNSEGWLAIDDGVDTSVVYSPAGGNPGGYIQRRDATAGYMHFQAPAAFHGNLTPYLNGTVSYDLLQTTASGDTSWFYRVVLQGAGLMLLYTEELPPDTVNWIHRSVRLNEQGWIVISGIDQFSGPAATAPQFQSVLANVTGFFITGDLISDTGDLASLDNVIVAEAPEPSTWMMVSFVLCGIPLIRKFLG
jgi:hypothetical protein